MQFLLWAVEGAVAGWLMAQIMLSKGREQARDVLMGFTGGIAGGFLVSVAHLLVRRPMIYTGLAAVLGALVLTVLVRYADGRHEYARQPE